MGELRTRKRGSTWQYSFEAAKINGKRKSVSKGGFRTKGEAIKAGTKAMNEYNNSGMSFSPTEISVSDYLDYWLENYVKINLKYNTRSLYARIVEKHLKPRFGAYKLKSLSTAAVQEYANQLKIEGYAKASVSSFLMVLSNSYEYAIEPLKFVQENPCKRVKIPKIEKDPRVRNIISPQMFQHIILRFPEGNIFYLPLMIGYYTGLRVGETFALTWNDIDMQNRTITVSKTAVKHIFNEDTQKATGEKYAWYFGPPKSKESNRTIKFGNTLYEALKKANITCKKNRLKYGEYYTNYYLTSELDDNGDMVYRVNLMTPETTGIENRADLICVRENGEYVSTETFKYCTRVIQKELGIEFDFHSMRHSHATLLIENGADLKDVQMRLGHADIRIELETYVHATATMKNRSVDIFEKAASI